MVQSGKVMNKRCFFVYANDLDDWRRYNTLLNMWKPDTFIKGNIAEVYSSRQTPYNTLLYSFREKYYDAFHLFGDALNVMVREEHVAKRYKRTQRMLSSGKKPGMKDLAWWMFNDRLLFDVRWGDE